MKNFSNLLGLTWSNFKSNWQRFLGLIAITFLFEAVFGLIIYFTVISRVAGNLSSIEDLNIILPALIQVWPMILLILAILALITYWLHLAIYFAAFDKTLAFGKVLALAGKKYLSAIGLLAIYVIIMTLGFIFFIIPALIVGVYLAPVFAVLLFENRGIFSAIKRSFELIKGKWWPIFGRLVLFSLLLGGIYLILAALKLQYISHLIQFLFWPIFLTTLYQELKGNETIVA